MKLKYILTFLLFCLMLGAVCGFAQQKPVQKKTIKAKAKKAAPAKTAAPVKTAANTKKRPVKTALADTTKKAGNVPPKKAEDQQSLNEEIVVTSTYKPVLADAVKNPHKP